ncbi:phospholipase A [Thalassolituus oleivorans]|uniref:Phospholipase A1 n=1 Tax=Thalassolituus oleivorans MIL-1 TaxID=1298593 RepID=M5DTB9_9GAMM|nr:phospholipase A [Thalassolituus oleivorans]CCU72769.1 phospholipase A1 [Thalassolituus oleivorans MIL-1]
MRIFLSVPLLLLFSSLVLAADASKLPVFGVPDVEPDIATESQSIEVLSADELDPQIRQFPELVEKIRTERLASDNPYVLLPHKPNYLLPLTYQTRPSDKELERALTSIADEPVSRENGYQHLEAVMQFSVKTTLAEDLLGKLSTIEFGYTNRSFWQVYNSAISKPFRETNHEPELMFNWQLKNYPVERLGLSINHQSNGQTSTLSRSWNRIIGEATMLIPDGVLNLRAWWRIPEKNSSDPEDPSDDDNPDIEEYLGYGELMYLHVMQHHQFSATVRNNLNWNENRGSLELGWSFPISRKMKGYVQYFNGYGESLIDYNRYQERFGIGIKLSDWF